jgi:hypothetical protein
MEIASNVPNFQHPASSALPASKAQPAPSGDFLAPALRNKVRDFLIPNMGVTPIHLLFGFERVDAYAIRAPALQKRLHLFPTKSKLLAVNETSSLPFIYC